MEVRCQKSYKQKTQAIHQKIQLAKQLEHTQRFYQNSLIYFGKQSLHKKIIEMEDNNDKKQEKTEFQILLEIQKSQLQESRMRIIPQFQQFQLQKDGRKQRDISFLKNTIKHLRSQLNRYNSVTEYIMSILSVAQKVIARYSKAIQEINSDHSPIIELRVKNQNLLEQIKICHSQQLKLKDQIKVISNLNEEIKRALQLALQEKDYFYHLLFEIHQGNCNDFIKTQKQAYANRVTDRRKDNAWSSIAQLIQINQNLKKRLQIS